VAALVPGRPDGDGTAEATLDAVAEPEIEVLDPRTHELLSGDVGPHPALLLIDPDSAEVLARETELAHHVRAIGDTYRDSLLLSFQDQSCGYARLTPGQPIEWVRTELCPKHIAAGEGGVFAHALVGPGTAIRQLVRIDVDAGRIELLTKGSQDLQNPAPAASGAAVAYERVLPRKYGELQHVAVCFDER
jgi:hypothetical protein